MGCEIMIHGHVLYRLISETNGIFRRYKTVGFVISLNTTRRTVIRDWWDILNLKASGVEFDNAIINLANKSFDTKDDLNAMHINGYHHSLNKTENKLYKAYKIAKETIIKRDNVWDTLDIKFKGIKQIGESLHIEFEKSSPIKNVVECYQLKISLDDNGYYFMQYVKTQGNKAMDIQSYGLDVRLGVETLIDKMVNSR